MDHRGPKLAIQFAVNPWLYVHPVISLEIDDSIDDRIFGGCC